MILRLTNCMNLGHMTTHDLILIAWGLIIVAAAVEDFPPVASLFDPLTAKANSSNKNDCSLNGDLQDGRCVCDAAWEGSECEFLRLLPANPDAGLQLHRQHPNKNGLYSSWGGSVLNGVYTCTSPEHPLAIAFTPNI